MYVGIQPRTQEVWQTLNLQHTLDARGNHVSEHAFWTANPSGKLERTHIGRECIHPTPYPWILAVPQYETEKVFDDELVSRGHYVDRPTQLLHYSYTDDVEYPIHAVVKHTYTNVTSQYKCKYLIGSDGAASVTRRLLGFKSDTSDADDVWAVADTELETDFPDQRRRCHIRTSDAAMMLIPSAGGLNRIYTQLTPDEVASLGGVDKNQLAKSESILMQTEWNDTGLLDILKKRLKHVFQPYDASIKGVQWVSQYRIRQRVINKFYDGSRIFLMGDACHTQSPKAAQGLNISMMDAYNLTWKLALVLQGTLQPHALETYETERLQIAQELIGFDRRIAGLYIKKDSLDKNNQEFQQEYYKAHGVTAGVGLQYNPNSLVSDDVSSIASDGLDPLTAGKRVYMPTVVRHIDGSSLNLLEDFPSNGRFHIFIFAGNAFTKSTLGSCASYLTSSSSPLTRYVSSTTSQSTKDWAFETIRRTRPENTGRPIDVFLIHTDNYWDHSIPELPAPFPEWKYRVYADADGKGHRDLGVDPSKGAMAVVRPDGIAGLVTGLDGGAAITEFLDKSLVVAKESGHVKENGYTNGASYEHVGPQGHNQLMDL